MLSVWIFLIDSRIKYLAEIFLLCTPALVQGLRGNFLLRELIQKIRILSNQLLNCSLKLQLRLEISRDIWDNIASPGHSKNMVSTKRPKFFFCELSNVRFQCGF